MCARVVVRSVFKQSRSPVGSISKEWETVIERECFYTIERSVFIKLVRKLLSSCVIAALLVFPAQAATSEEIQQQIDSAIEKQNMAHQIAEYVRSFGESEDNPAILLPRRNGGNSSAFSQISTNSMTRPFKMKITRGNISAHSASPIIARARPVMEDILEPHPALPLPHGYQ